MHSALYYAHAFCPVFHQQAADSFLIVRDSWGQSLTGCLRMRWLYVIVFYIIRNRGIMEQNTYIFTFEMAKMYNPFVP